MYIILIIYKILFFIYQYAIRNFNYFVNLFGAIFRFYGFTYLYFFVLLNLHYENNHAI
jgi:hypothetical protein